MFSLNSNDIQIQLKSTNLATPATQAACDIRDMLMALVQFRSKRFAIVPNIVLLIIGTVAANDCIYLVYRGPMCYTRNPFLYVIPTSKILCLSSVPQTGFFYPVRCAQQPNTNQNVCKIPFDYEEYEYSVNCTY